MKQLIDRDVAVSGLEAFSDYEMTDTIPISEVIAFLQGLPTHKAEEEWTKVDVRDKTTWPEYSDTNNALLALEFWDGSKHSVTTGHCKDEDDALWFVENCELNRNWNVTHHRPLPQPPEVER